MEGLLEPEEVESTVATVEVRETFKASRVGTIAGSHGHRGHRHAAAPRCAWCATARSSTTAGSARCAASRTTSARSPQGMECGIVLENYADVKEGDVLEVTRSAGGADAVSAHGRSSASCELDLHLPDNGDLKGKRKELQSLKAQLQRRFGAAVAETDHHDLWQRSTLDARAGGARARRPLDERADALQRLRGRPLRRPGRSGSAGHAHDRRRRGRIG